MKVVIDSAIPYIAGVLEPYAEVVYRAGEEFSTADIKDADALIIRTRTRCGEALLEGSSVKLIATATSNNYGYVSGRWNLGIMVGQVSDSHGEKYVNINQVFEKGNCYLAGVKAGDIVTSLTFCGETYDVTVDNFHKYVALMRTKLKQGDSFTISVDRKVTNSVYNNVDIVVNISVADFIFCDTGM